MASKKKNNIAKGQQKSKLLRYKNILQVYTEHKTEDIPDTVILRKHIFPIYPISYRTLVTILGTPVEKQLKEIAEIESKQLSMFPATG